MILFQNSCKKYGAFFFAGFLAFGLVSCQKEEGVPPLQIDFRYFPLETGRYIVYDVDSIGYNSFDGSTQVSSYQIEERVDSSFVNDAGSESFKIIRSRRKDENSVWFITDVWSANITETTAEKVEENLRFIKLHFPVQLNSRWYGNNYIQTDSDLVYLADWVYEYTAVHAPAAINGLAFDSVLTVMQFEEQNLIEDIRYQEKYASGVGLVYKEERNISTQPGESPNGFSIVMQVKEYR
jgi:hypothetical protein